MHPKDWPWSIGEAVFLLALVAGVMNGIGFLSEGFLVRLSLLQRFFWVGMAQTGLILLAYAFLRRRHGLRGTGFWPARREWTYSLTLGLAGGVLLLLVVVWAGIWWQSLLPGEPPPLQPFGQAALAAQSPREWAFAALLAMLVAPLGEEVLFRGFVYSALRRRWGIPAAAIGSGVVFGLLHADLLRLFPLALGGAGLALLYERGGRLLVPFLAHGVWNGIMLLVLALFGPV